MKAHLFNSETRTTTREKSLKKKELSPRQRRKLYKRDMKKREQRKRDERIQHKQNIWNDEHLDDLEWDDEHTFIEWPFDDDDFCSMCNAFVCPYGMMHYMVTDTCSSCENN